MKLNYSTTRYAIVTLDEKQILVGRAREYHFVDIDKIGNSQINTFFSENKAKASFDNSWYENEEVNGKWVKVNGDWVRSDNWKHYKVIKLKITYKGL
jgi:hypothetical protein